MDFKTEIRSGQHGGGNTSDQSQMPKPSEDAEFWPLSEKPHFIEVLCKKHVARSFQLEIPSDVSDKLPTTSVPAKIVYRGNMWNLLYLGDQKPKKKFDKEAWGKFVTDNNLKIGDACVFELMEGNLTSLFVKFKVQILRNDFPSELLEKAEGARDDNPIEIE